MSSYFENNQVLKDIFKRHIGKLTERIIVAGVYLSGRVCLAYKELEIECPTLPK